MMFWQALETIMELAAVEPEWRGCLDDNEWELARPFLRAEDGLASSVSLERGRRLRVVEPEPDEFVAFDPETEDAIPISREDLIIWAVSLPRVAQAVGSALKLRSSVASSGVSSRVVHAGDLAKDNGFFPVFLVAAHYPSEFQRCVRDLLAASRCSFIVLAPTTKLFQATQIEELRERGHEIVALEGLLPWHRPGIFAATRDFRSVVRLFLDRNTGRAGDKIGTEPFSTPPGTRWHQVTIRFLDADSICITVAGEQRVLTYRDAGFADGRRPDRHTKLWALLTLFSENPDNAVTWDRRGANRYRKKQKEDLDKVLRRLCGIPTTAFEKYGSGWRPLFKLESWDPARSREHRRRASQQKCSIAWPCNS